MSIEISELAGMAPSVPVDPPLVEVRIFLRRIRREMVWTTPEEALADVKRAVTYGEFGPASILSITPAGTPAVEI